MRAKKPEVKQPMKLEMEIGLNQDGHVYVKLGELVAAFTSVHAAEVAGHIWRMASIARQQKKPQAEQA